MLVYGPQFSVVGLTVEIRSVGRVPLVIGRGVAAIIGTAARGPIAEPILLGSSADARQTFYQGDLYEGCQLLFGNGADVVAAIRVGGSGHETADLDLTDDIGDPETVGTVVATSPGAWGNQIRMTIDDGAYPGFEFLLTVGDGTVGPYYFENADLVESSDNFVTVGGEALGIVYATESLEAGKVYINKTEGSMTFFEGEAPTTSEVIEASVEHKTRYLTITDNRTIETFNVSSIVKMQAALLTSSLVRFEPVPGKTHLPKTGIDYVLTGGLDGSAITVNDWVDAMEQTMNLPQSVVPTTCVICDHEVVLGSNDLIPRFSLMLTEAANRFIPMIGFVAAKKNSTMQELLRLKSSYNNPFLVIVGNGWDAGSPEQNLAVARAGTEAGIQLGDSAAEYTNAIQGANSLLVTFKQEVVDVLTYNGVDVLIKSTGILPYLGVTTNPDPNFTKTVDMRTVAYCMVVLNYVSKRFYHKRRTRQTMASLKGTLEAVFEEMVYLQVLDDFWVEVKTNYHDKNRLDVDLWIQPVGHVQRIRVVLSTGYWSDKVA
jgi:hypothetical protein